MTAAEYEEITRELLLEYLTPFYQLMGAISAVVVMLLAYYLIIEPFMKRGK